MRIVADDLTGAAIGDLLRFHLEEAHRNSPPGSVYAFDIERLRAPDMSFWSVWDGDALAGCGALKQIDAWTGELKSMRTAPGHLRRGVAGLVLDHMVGVARERGYRRLSLETGSGDAYEAAQALYARRGFRFGPRFGDYVGTDFNRFMHLDL